mmetsp:Transcript_27182/g.68158  ORF Transcript_27182/g.68158 Transcript_27182/m.68158 type:complete len:281 (+) Transcript_27182:127-969(+)
MDPAPDLDAASADGLARVRAMKGVNLKPARLGVSLHLDIFAAPHNAVRFALQHLHLVLFSLLDLPDAPSLSAAQSFAVVRFIELAAATISAFFSAEDAVIFPALTPLEDADLASSADRFSRLHAKWMPGGEPKVRYIRRRIMDVAREAYEASMTLQEGAVVAEVVGPLADAVSELGPMVVQYYEQEERLLSGAMEKQIGARDMEELTRRSLDVMRRNPLWVDMVVLMTLPMGAMAKGWAKSVLGLKERMALAGWRKKFETKYIHPLKTLLESSEDIIPGL